MKFKVYRLAEPQDGNGIPLYLCPVSAGFPCPTDEYVEDEIDLNRILIQNPEATFLLEVCGESMVDAHLYNGDRLIVDTSLEAAPNNIVIATISGEFTVKRLIKKRGRFYLKPENEKYNEIDITDDETVEIRGVVTYIIHKAR